MYGTSISKTYARSTRDVLAAIADSLSFGQALSSATWWPGSIEVIRLRDNDSILLHAGAG